MGHPVPPYNDDLECVQQFACRKKKSRTSVLANATLQKCSFSLLLTLRREGKKEIINTKKKKQKKSSSTESCDVVFVGPCRPIHSRNSHSRSVPTLRRRSSHRRVAVCVCLLFGLEKRLQHDRWTRFNPIRVKDRKERAGRKSPLQQAKMKEKKKRHRAHNLSPLFYSLSLSLSLLRAYFPAPILLSFPAVS